MKIYPEQKPSLMEVTLPILCALLSNPHYTLEATEGNEPDVFKTDNGKDWKSHVDDNGRQVILRRYSTKALEDAMEIGREFMNEMDLDEEFQKD